MSDDDKIKPLPVRFKAPPTGETMLKVVRSRSGECDHRWFFAGGQMKTVTYLIREGETEVECGNCNTKLDPMFVLLRLANEETQWARTREAYIEEMRRLSERQRTKCEHCEKMTRISRR
jgi:hypothetical protein